MTPGSASAVFDASFNGGTPLSFASPIAANTFSDLSHFKTTLPVSKLFAQPALNIMITPTSNVSQATAVSAVFMLWTALHSPEMTLIDSEIAQYLTVLIGNSRAVDTRDKVKKITTGVATSN